MNDIEYSKYDPTYRDNILCECGHEYWRHFNKKTGEPQPCLNLYECDCERFKPAEILFWIP